MTPTIQDCLIQFQKRAERAGDDKLIETFVDAAPLLASVSTTDNQVIFGRRGTGKTHIFKYLDDSIRRNGDLSIYLDLRSVGSNSSVYNDRQRTHAQRATPLLLDVLQALHEALLEVAIDNAEEVDLSKLGPELDQLSEAISTVEVVGSVERSVENSCTDNQQSQVEIGVDLNLDAPKFSAKATGSSGITSSNKEVLTRSGDEFFYVKFGAVQNRLKAVLGRLGARRVWLLLDEWAEVPLDIQPYLADLLRRCVLPLPQMTLKIAAIEHRSNMIIRRQGEYIGIELGADAGGDVNLDDFMVLDNDASRAKQFFSALLFKHYRATDGLSPNIGPQSPEEFINQTFTQITAFEEFVRAVEGVPRDAVYLASTVATLAYGRLISVQDVRDAARTWYHRDKATVLRSAPEMNDLLHWITEEVIAHRRARAFLLTSNLRFPLIDTLFDSRLLHVLKKNISSQDNPGTRYDVYKLDYGCYVELISTSRAPGGLLPSDDGEAARYVDVPPDDYRSIRSAILDLTTFEAAQKRRATTEAAQQRRVARKGVGSY